MVTKRLKHKIDTCEGRSAQGRQQDPVGQDQKLQEDQRSGRIEIDITPHRKTENSKWVRQITRINTSQLAKQAYNTML